MRNRKKMWQERCERLYKERNVYARYAHALEDSYDLMQMRMQDAEESAEQWERGYRELAGTPCESCLGEFNDPTPEEYIESQQHSD